MPNHCENDLYVRRNWDASEEEYDAQLKEFMRVTGADKGGFDFNAAIPYPDEWAKLDAEYGELGYVGFEKKHGRGARNGFNSGGYEWCQRHWGTKWNAYDVEVSRRKGRTTITFDTAWSPPLPVIKKLATMFPALSLSLEFFESGVGYCGGFWIDDDRKEHEWESKYPGMRGG